MPHVKSAGVELSKDFLYGLCFVHGSVVNSWKPTPIWCLLAFSLIKNSFYFVIKVSEVERSKLLLGSFRLIKLCLELRMSFTAIWSPLETTAQKLYCQNACTDEKVRTNFSQDSKHCHRKCSFPI